jgi:Tol biopolymer transport system component
MRALVASVAVALTMVAGPAGAVSDASPLLISADRSPRLNGKLVSVDRRGRRTEITPTGSYDSQQVLSPDGSRIAFIRANSYGETTSGEIRVVGVDGRDDHALTGRGAVSLVGWAPDGGVFAWVPAKDGSDLVVLHHGGRRVISHVAERWSVATPGSAGLTEAAPDGRAFVVEVWDRLVGAAKTWLLRAGRPPIRLPEGSASWSALGRLVVDYVTDSRPRRFRVAVYSESGERISEFPALLTWWSPDGRWLVSAREKSARLDIRDGRGRLVFTSLPHVVGRTRCVVSAAWIDARRFAFCLGAGTQYEVALDVVSRRIEPVTAREVKDATCGCVSKDSRADTARDGTRFAIRIGPRSGGKPRVVAHVPACWDDGVLVPGVAWQSPVRLTRSDRVVFVTWCGAPNAHLYLVAPGGQRRPLLVDEHDERNPQWSPDGSRIAFDEAPASGTHMCPCPPSVDVMGADGTTRQRVLDERTGFGLTSWSPDATQLLLSQQNNDDGSLEWAVIPSTGGRPRTLSAPRSDVDWGGDGLVFESDDGISTMHSDGSGARLLLPTQAKVTSLTAARDGSLAWVQRSGRVETVWTLPAGSTAPTLFAAVPRGKASRLLTWGTSDRLVWIEYTEPPGDAPVAPETTVADGRPGGHVTRTRIHLDGVLDLAPEPVGERLALVAFPVPNRIDAEDAADLYMFDPARGLHRLTHAFGVLFVRWQPPS